MSVVIPDYRCIAAKTDRGFHVRLWATLLFSTSLVILPICAPLAQPAGEATVQLASSATAADAGAGSSTGANLSSADGRYVLFQSDAPDLVAGVTDTNADLDVFVFDRVSATTTLVSRAAGSASVTPNRDSYVGAISADGQWVVYRTKATDVMAGVTDSNNIDDVFLFDMSSATTILVSRALGSATVTADDFSYPDGISADGRFVLFNSTASNIVSGVTDANGTYDLFVFDRLLGSSSLISRSSISAQQTANSFTLTGTMSPDGRWVAFSSYATDVVSGLSDNNNNTDIFLLDRSTGVLKLVSRLQGQSTVTANGTSQQRALSSDGRFVLFATNSTNIVPGQSDSNGQDDVFLFDRVSGTSQLVSRASTAPGTTGNSISAPIGLSANGEWVLFDSAANNLINTVTDTNSAYDVFVFNRVSQQTALISRDSSNPSNTANGHSRAKAISADGQSIVLASMGTNLVAGVVDANGAQDAVLFDRSNSTAILLSRSFGSATTTANAASTVASVSANGNAVTLDSEATDLIGSLTDANDSSDVFLFDRSNGSNTLASRAFADIRMTGNRESSTKVMSRDGRWVVYTSLSTNVIEGMADSNDVEDVFLFDRTLGTQILVSRALGSPTTTSNGISVGTSISDDGRWITYFSDATNVMSGLVDSNFNADAFLFDRETQTTTLMSHSAASASQTAEGSSLPRAISADGRWVVLESMAYNLDATVNDTNQREDVYLYDHDTQSNTLVSRSFFAPNQTPSQSSVPVALTPDGRWILFQSADAALTNATDNNGALDAFLFDHVTATTTLLSSASGMATLAADDHTYPIAISPDGRWVLLDSRATNLVDGVTDLNWAYDVFLLDRQSAIMTLVSRSNVGSTDTPNHNSEGTGVSADGRWILFDSTATNIVPAGADTNSARDVFLFDRSNAVTTLISAATGTGTTANQASFANAISADGRRILFGTAATNIIAGLIDPFGSFDVFLWDNVDSAPTLLSRTPESATTTASGSGTQLSDDGQIALLSSTGINLIDGLIDSNKARDVFVAVLPIELFADGFE